MRSLLWLFDTVISLYIYVLVANAIFSWLVAFGVINTRNSIVAGIGDFLFRVTEPVLARLMLAHGPLAAVIALGSVAIFLPYAITRARHDQISTRLRLQRATAFAPPDGVSPGA